MSTFVFLKKIRGSFSSLNPMHNDAFAGSPKVSFVQEFSLCKQLEQSNGSIIEMSARAHKCIIASASGGNLSKNS